MQYFKISAEDRQRVIDMIGEAPSKFTFNPIMILLKLDPLIESPSSNQSNIETGIALPDSVI